MPMAMAVDAAVDHAADHNVFMPCSTVGSGHSTPERMQPMSAHVRIAPMSEEDKRERQRMHVRNSYYKKRNAMCELRKEAQALEERYAAALKDRSRREQQLELAVQDMHVTDTLPPHCDKQGEEAVQLFMQLSNVRDALRRENAELKKAVIEYSNFQRRIARIADDTYEEERAGLAGDGISRSPGVAILPGVTRAECHAIAAAAFQEILNFQRSDSFVTTGASVFGWRDRRTVDNSRLTFDVKKFFQGREALDLSLRTWDVLSSPKLLPQLYSACIHMRVVEAQVVDEDNVVFYRTIHNSDGQVVIRSLFLLTRFRTDNSYIILFRSINRDRLQYLSTEDNTDVGEWHDVFSWTIFEEQGELQESCLLHFGGLVPSTVAANARFWMLEVLLIGLRWESRVVGPMFSLCAQ